jgi:hypothetical protein
VGKGQTQSPKSAAESGFPRVTASSMTSSGGSSILPLPASFI